MSEKKIVKPVALAIGAALAGTFAISGAVNAEAVDNPFEMSALSSGYMLGAGEGSCGGDTDKKKGEGSCGEGSCGEKEGEGSCGEKEGEGSCGEKEGEGSCGEKEGEGSCGEGSCGADTDEKKGEGSCGGSA